MTEDERPIGKGFFPSTRWSEVDRAAHEGPEENRRAMGRLLERYMPALRKYLVSVKGLNPDTADDLLQGFVLDKIISDQLLTSADRDRGKFRTFLIVVLNHYLSNSIRHEKTKRRGPTGGFTVDITLIGDLADRDVEIALPFEREWALHVFEEALSQLRQECKRLGRMNIWTVFAGRMVDPILHQAEPVAYDRLVRECGFDSPVQACNALVTGKRMFLRILRSVVGNYVKNESEIDAEVDALRQILSQHGA